MAALLEGLLSWLTFPLKITDMIGILWYFTLCFK